MKLNRTLGLLLVATAAVGAGAAVADAAATTAAATTLPPRPAPAPAPGGRHWHHRHGGMLVGSDVARDPSTQPDTGTADDHQGHPGQRAGPTPGPGTATST